MRSGMVEVDVTGATNHAATGGLTDPAAFGRLFDATLPRVFGYFIARVGGRVAVAEDLTQETFLAAVAAVQRGAAVVEPMPWLFGIARHKLLDHYRGDMRPGQPIQSNWDEEIADRQAFASFDLHAQHVRDRVIDTLDRLPASQRAAMVLHYLDGLPVADVAALTGRSVHAVESLLARGRANFKRTYLEIGDD